MKSMASSAISGPLKSLKIVEFAGLAPVPMAGMILADLGASVLRIDRVNSVSLDTLARGKRSLALDLKKPEGLKVVERVAQSYDILIEPFRPGIMEKLGLGPEKLLRSNERLIYARLSGYGQKGDLSSKAGHDINYLAMSGVLSMLGRKSEKPFPPINLLGDFAGGSLLCIIGILSALVERSITGKGQVIDSSITDGTAYLSSFLHRSKSLFIWQGERGTNVLDSGAFFYDTYETKDGKYMAVGALEPLFYRDFVEGIELPELLDQQLNRELWPENKEKVADRFRTKTREEWTRIFEKRDGCVTPVLDLNEAPLVHKELGRETFMKNTVGGKEIWEPCQSPHLSGHKLSGPRPQPEVGEHTTEVLYELGYDKKEVDHFLTEKIVQQFRRSASL